VDNVPVSGKSLLDVGCGLGDLYAYLREKGIVAGYTGVDILEGMIEKARRRYPAGAFLVGNIFDRNFMRKRKFDLIYCSGIFNLKIGDNAALLKRALSIFFALARETVVFNLLDSRSPDKDDRYCYFSQEDVKSLLLPYDWDTQFIGDYLPNDFTVICRNA
jgi:trans-aconitate methyltransferase